MPSQGLREDASDHLNTPDGRVSPSVQSSWSGQRALLLCEAGLGVFGDDPQEKQRTQTERRVSSGPSAYAIME